MRPFSCQWGTGGCGSKVHRRRKDGEESRNSFTRFSVARDGFAAGLLAMIHCSRVRIESLLAVGPGHTRESATTHDARCKKVRAVH